MIFPGLSSVSCEMFPSIHILSVCSTRSVVRRVGGAAAVEGVVRQNVNIVQTAAVKLILCIRMRFCIIDAAAALCTQSTEKMLHKENADKNR